MKFFGREVSDKGCEMVIKVGSRFADPGDPYHFTSWRDGQIIDIMPLGFHTGTQMGYCCTLLKFPNIDYAAIGGKWQEDWQKMSAETTLWDKVHNAVNIDGKYEWEVLSPDEFKSIRHHRDYFIDFKGLENDHLITKSEKGSTIINWKTRQDCRAVSTGRCFRAVIGIIFQFLGKVANDIAITTGNACDIALL